MHSFRTVTKEKYSFLLQYYTYKFSSILIFYQKSKLWFCFFFSLCHFNNRLLCFVVSIIGYTVFAVSIIGYSVLPVSRFYFSVISLIQNIQKNANIIHPVEVNFFLDVSSSATGFLVVHHCGLQLPLSTDCKYFSKVFYRNV